MQDMLEKIYNKVEKIDDKLNDQTKEVSVLATEMKWVKKEIEVHRKTEGEKLKEMDKKLKPIVSHFSFLKTTTKVVTLFGTLSSIVYGAIKLL